MHQFLNAVEEALQQRNFYAALTTALALPDICCWVESPPTSGQKYAAWFDKYVKEKYTYEVGANKSQQVFLQGSDCYALRCACLHQGGDNIETQRARKILKDFVFIEPPAFGQVHCNLSDGCSFVRRIDPLYLTHFPLPGKRCHAVI